MKCGVFTMTVLFHAAKLFKSMIQRMPYGALPVVSKAGGILEYPAPLLSDFSTDAVDGPTTGKTKIGEEADKGHRHFSHMHWLYPGLFIPKSAHASNGGINNLISTNLITSHLTCCHIISYQALA